VFGKALLHHSGSASAMLGAHLMELFDAVMLSGLVSLACVTIRDWLERGL
jgi:hypothetical protein